MADNDESTEEIPRPPRAAHLLVLDMLMIPALTSMITAAFTLGGLWVTFGNVRAQADDNAEAIDVVAANQDAHDDLAGHPIAMERWDNFGKRLTRIENEDRQQGYNIVAICTVTGAACELAVTP